ncbi:MAG: bifunctional oligoribonuclease/PAP phosphatase NrnA [Oligoflexia bacterium]|nr:bifunctional oligoribonuclease/PAP phosphatase NrnA [Oligoflexia bacterium]
MHPFFEVIKNANSIVLSTHTQPDGDGLGSQVALFWALKKAGKKVRILNVDDTPKKYNFLDPHKNIETFNHLKTPLEKTDVALIFDTNDPELLLGLWDELQTKCKKVLIVDHHPPLERYPLQGDEHFIDTNSSSTGQIAFSIIKTMNIALDAQIALPLYASIVFDTNYFRYIRGDSTPHLIAAELLRHNIEPQQVHRHLFGNHTPNKLKFLSQVLGAVEYECEGRLACVRVRKDDMNALGLEMDDTRDIIDMVINVESIEAAVLFREEAKDHFKVSFRSKGLFGVSDLAQSLGGGGHQFSSGAYAQSTYPDLKSKVLKGFEKLFTELEKKAVSG